MLSRIHVSHYRSLGNVSLSLTPVTVLVGRNGSGKSNIIDSIRFLRDCMTYGVDHAITDRGGIKAVRQYSPTRPYKLFLQYDFLIEVPQFLKRKEGSSKVTHKDATYILEIGSRKGGTFVVEREYAHWPERHPVFFENIENPPEEHVSYLTLERDRNGDIAFSGPESFVSFASIRELKVPVDQLAVGSVPLFFGDSLKDQIESLRFAQIYPNVLRDPQRPDIERSLRENCSNWASVMRQLQKSPRGRRTIERIVELLQPTLPSFTGIRVQTVGNFIIPYFQFNDPATDRSFSLEPSQLSDGTLRVFAILLALYQAPYGGLISIEEPEQTVHPGLLKTLAEAIRERSTELQVLITTHSPELIDLFDVDEIRVTDMTDSGTVIGTVDSIQRDAIRDRLMSPAEIMSLDGFKVGSTDV